MKKVITVASVLGAFLSVSCCEAMNPVAPVPVDLSVESGKGKPVVCETESSEKEQSWWGLAESEDFRKAWDELEKVRKNMSLEEQSAAKDQFHQAEFRPMYDMMILMAKQEERELETEIEEKGAYLRNQEKSQAAFDAYLKKWEEEMKVSRDLSSSVSPSSPLQNEIDSKISWLQVRQKMARDGIGVTQYRWCDPAVAAEASRLDGVIVEKFDELIALCRREVELGKKFQELCERQREVEFRRGLQVLSRQFMQAYSWQKIPEPSEKKGRIDGTLEPIQISSVNDVNAHINAHKTDFCIADISSLFVSRLPIKAAVVETFDGWDKVPEGINCCLFRKYTDPRPHYYLLSNRVFLPLVAFRPWSCVVSDESSSSEDGESSSSERIAPAGRRVPEGGVPSKEICAQRRLFCFVQGSCTLSKDSEEEVQRQASELFERCRNIYLTKEADECKAELKRGLTGIIRKMGTEVDIDEAWMQDEISKCVKAYEM